ncbi:TIGR03619 family F420-dependent LLM class oxidoreductase [Streptomyces paludis]|uniref:TIGR03619 family F420-dependent LLM class oxidoreductase n=2 Tax=Streptomyces paludis TaxID=2282738 RepID=A0A345HLN4_9ACTN|nr:TIGR03619 family F420-dependent LLM class oxidoreductase [Streptomyces paludis]
MRLGVVLPDGAPGADPRTVVALARHAEALGYAAVWLPDHPLPPAPYGPVYGGVFEPLTLLAHIAAVTDRITLGTSVLILPLRDPFLLAKQTATLERLAPGRVVLGVGVGWERSEFDALRVEFGDRGARTDEAIELIQRLHRTGGVGGADGTGFRGRFYAAESGVFEPRPTAPVPLMIGGTSDAALRRAARVGDMWQAFGLTPDEFTARKETLRTLAAGRRVRAGTVISLTDSDREIAALARYARRWEAAGAEQLGIHFGEPAGAVERMTEFMRRYGEEGARG